MNNLSDQDRMIYFWEIRTRVEFAERAWGEALEALKASSVDDFWYSVDSFLSASIAVANILWPSAHGEQVKSRATSLRSAINASPDAPIGLRKVRNGFEHFDERIDEWRARTKHRIFVDTNIGPLISGVDVSDTARHFDPTTGVLSVFGKITSPPDVLAELTRIRLSLPARY